MPSITVKIHPAVPTDAGVSNTGLIGLHIRKLI